MDNLPPWLVGPTTSSLELLYLDIPSTTYAIWWLSDEVHSDGRKHVGSSLLDPVIVGVKTIIVVCVVQCWDHRN